MSTLDVRPATRADSGAWLRMRRALWPEHEGESHAREIDQYFAGELREPVEVLIAFDGAGVPVGLAELSIRSHAEGCATGRVAYLEGWYVEPHVRRTGLGRSLIAAAERWAIAQGCTEFASDAEIDNAISAAAHHALGFDEVERLRCFRKALTGSSM